MRLLGVVLLITTLVPWVNGATVVIMPVPGPKSPLLVHMRVTKEIAARGINTAWLAHDVDAPLLESSGFSPVITYTGTSHEGLGPAKGNVTVAGPQNPLHMFSKILNMFERSCNNLMSNATALAAVKDLKPNLLIGFHVLPCLPILASKLDLQYVSISPAGPLDPLLTTLYSNSHRRMFLPAPLSYLPQMGMRVTSQHMTYLQRARNFARFCLFHAGDFLYIRPKLQAVYKSHGVDLQDPRERRRHVLTLFSADWAVEWVRPLLPNTKMVGPILPEPAQALPADLQEFMEAAGGRGVLVVATGTVATLGVKERLQMAAAFAELPVHVLWRLSAKEVPDEAALAALSLGNNTKNDVLGHPQTRAFLSHCGANSLYEAAYHGVPVVALPFFGDQPGNADKAVAKGFAVPISHADLGTSAFSEAILRVLEDPKYALAAANASTRIRARPRTPVQEAADWIEHTLATGADAYLRTPEADMGFVRQHNLDVVASYLAAALAAVALTWRLLALAAGLARRGARRSTAPKTKEL